ncbi:MAG: hypothetical protein AAB769_02300 [Patescibacteria group bacterium]
MRPNESPDRVSPREDNFAFFSIASQIAKKLFSEMDNGGMTQEERTAWLFDFPALIQGILMEHPDICEIYQTEQDTAIRMIKDEMKKMHPNNS